MNGKKQRSAFQYTYSAEEQEEVRRIRSKYIPDEESKLERLRRLDLRVTQKAQAVSLIFGVLGALVLGLGMSLAMSELGAVLGLSSGISMLLGVAIGLVGAVLIALAYPVYNRVIRQERQRIAPEILRLTDELIK